MLLLPLLRVAAPDQATLMSAAPVEVQSTARFCVFGAIGTSCAVQWPTRAAITPAPKQAGDRKQKQSKPPAMASKDADRVS